MEIYPGPMSYILALQDSDCAHLLPWDGAITHEDNIIRFV